MQFPRLMAFGNRLITYSETEFRQFVSWSVPYLHNISLGHRGT
jgi:hypothetical protein